MILLLPEAKHVVEKQGRTKPFRAMRFAEDAAGRSWGRMFTDLLKMAVFAG